MDDVTCCEVKANGSKLYWDEPQITSTYGVSVRTVQRWVRSGQFPRPFRLGRKKLWIPEQVIGWMQQKGQEAQETQAARNMVNYEAPVRRQRRKRHDD